jgi:hypothetical protein
MATLTFDTYAFIRKLKESGIPEEQARAQVEALSTAFEQFHSELHLTDVATSRDIRELELKIEALRVELKRDTELLKAEVRRDIAENKAELIRWVVGAGFLQTALITGLLLKISSVM